MLGTAALVVLPWTLRNYLLFERVIPVSTAGWVNLSEGNTLSGESWLRPDIDALDAFREQHFAIADEMERADFARRHGLALIRAEQPTWLLKKLVRNLALLASPDSFLFKKISRGAYGTVHFTIVRAVLIATALSYVGVVVFGVLGIAAARESGRAALPGLVLGAALALAVVANSSSRYRLPFMPLLMVYAAHGLLHWRTLPRRLAGRRWLVPGAILLFFFGVCVPHFYPDAASLWSHGTYVEPRRP